MRIGIRIIALLALAAALPILLAGPGVRLGFWDYGLGLKMIREVSAPKEIFGGLSLPPLFTAAGVSLIAGLAGLFMKQARAGLLAVLAALVAFGAGAVPLKMKAAFEGNPFIHEVTTDFDNPPAIVAAADLPRKNPPDYRGADPVPQREDGQTVADAQREAFPDIQPMMVEADMKMTADAAHATVKSMGMTILAEGPADNVAGGGWRIEAVATSFWFGFKDDFIIRLTPVGKGMTRIDIRSKSRVGGSDLGANAARVREFTKRFKERI
ncbi:MAG: DUF1499 domain-containing protein [Parvularculaceae bacterium]|nr:DUF1499 domain-containing protein [Parvularculaceae bacterium]